MGSSDQQYLESNIIDMTLAIVGALLVAIEGIFIKKISVLQNSFTALFWANLFGLLIFTPFIFQAEQISNVMDLSFLFFLGPISLIGQYLYYLAFRQADVSTLSPITYVWVIYGTFIGWFWFDEEISAMGITGILCILVGACILARTKSNPSSI